MAFFRASPRGALFREFIARPYSAGRSFASNRAHCRSNRAAGSISVKPPRAEGAAESRAEEREQREGRCTAKNAYLCKRCTGGDTRFIDPSPEHVAARDTAASATKPRLQKKIRRDRYVRPRKSRVAGLRDPGPRSGKS